MLGCVEFQTRRSKALFQTLFIFCVWRSGRTLCAETIGTPLVSVFFFCVRPQLRGEQFFRERANTTQRCNTTQHNVATLLRHCLEWLQHCPNIATLCCAENRRCESSRVTWPLSERQEKRWPLCSRQQCSRILWLSRLDRVDAAGRA